MILADTSVWIEHLRIREGVLSALLVARQIAMHPFVTGEVLLGSLRDPVRVADELLSLRITPVASDVEVRQFIRSHELSGTGIGYVDAHLLSAAKLLPGTLLWTFDQRLNAVAARLHLAYQIN
jgi:predicted nucleic acid-binding protein